jgi:uncharacterized cupredoxin-like copper-binding protein
LLRIALLAALVALAVAVAAGAMPKTATVSATEQEFKLSPKPTKVKTGKVTFTVRNIGHLAHEFIVLKTNIAANKLPKKGQRAVEVGRVGRIPGEIKAGQTKTLTLNLKPGKYVLLCNLPAHYASGQYAAFTVS